MNAGGDAATAEKELVRDDNKKRCAVAVVAEAVRFMGRARVILLCDQEKPIKKLAELVRDSRTHDTVAPTALAARLRLGRRVSCSFT